MPQLSKNGEYGMEKSVKHAIVLCQDHVYFGGMQLVYRFSVLAGEEVNRYLISVSLEKETCEADAGGDLSRALGHYHRVRDGYVTPCGLDDVMHELHYA